MADDDYAPNDWFVRIIIDRELILKKWANGEESLSNTLKHMDAAFEAAKSEFMDFIVNEHTRFRFIN